MCEHVLLESIKKAVSKKKEISKKVKVDLDLMYTTLDKISCGMVVDPIIVSNILLGGVINILHQHDTIEELDKIIKSVEESSLTDKLRVELLENLIMT